MTDPTDSASPSQDRARAARVLVAVIHGGKTLDQTFDQVSASPLQRELVYGSLRHYYSLEALVTARLSRALRSKDLDLRCLMLVGAYQLQYMRIPDHAVINETVNACRALRKPWARGLVNAVLRKLSKTTMEPATEHSFELPEWIERLIREGYPDAAEPLLRASVERAPMSLRINLNRSQPESYSQQLAARGIVSHPGWHPENLLLEEPVSVRTLPGFEDGLVSIQDAGAQFAAGLITGSVPARRILDACAAPGGKLFHIAEQMAGKGSLTGLELSEQRLDHLRAEARRLGHSDVKLVHGDATNLIWHDGEAFDAILLDAPCSGSGTLRRHPDIKLLRVEADLENYAQLQRRLLANLWQILAPGGTLVYCTCSLFSCENDAVITAHLDSVADARIVPIELEVGRPTHHGWQLLPLPSTAKPDKSVDGFYFARMTRR